MSGSKPLPPAIDLGDQITRALDSIPAYVYVKDASNRILYANRRVADSLGTTPEAMADTPSERWYPDHAGLYLEDDLEVLETGRPKLGIVEPKRTPTGERRLETDKFPIFDRDGKPSGIFVIARDTTERERRREELQRVTRLDAMGRLAGGLAHNLNNLLTVLLGAIESAGEDHEAGLDPRDNLRVAASAVSHASSLTRRMLALAGTHAGGRQPVDLNTLLDQAEGMVRAALPVNVECRLERADQPACVSADPDLLHEVLLNLVLNARDAMPEGGVLSVSVSVSEASCCLTVSDTGHGIDPNAQEHLFEPFFSTRAGKGTGLGLAVSYGIVRQHDGEIAVCSEPGEGAEFAVSLPRVSETPEPLAAASRETERSDGETVLLVEDEPEVLRLGRRILERAGYRVLSAENGDRALALMATVAEQPDLVLTDVAMPGMSGPELVQRLRERGIDAPVLLTSGHAETPAARFGTPFLPKPFSRGALLAAVADAIKNRGS